MQVGAESLRRWPQRQRPRRFQRWLFAAALAVLVLGTVAGFFVAREEAAQRADRRQASAAGRAAAALEREVEQALTSLSGAAAVVDRSGALDPTVFEAFARDVTSQRQLDRVLLVARVGSDASTSFPVLAAEPSDGADSVVGTDLGRRPALRSAMRSAVEDRAAAVSVPVPLPGGPGDGLVLFRPLLHGEGSGADVVGFVATALALQELDQTVAAAAGDSMDVAVLKGDERLVGDDLRPHDDVESRVAAAAGESWRVAVRPQDGPHLLPAWLVAGGGAAATLAMAALVLVTERHQRNLATSNVDLARSEARLRAVQGVAGELAQAFSAQQVMETLIEHLPTAVEAHRVAIGVLADDGTLAVWDGNRRGDRLALDGPEPLLSSIMASGEPAWWRSPLEWRRDSTAALLAGGGQAMAVLPLRAGEVSGVLAVAYGRVHIFSDEERGLLTTVALLAARAVARAQRYDAEHQLALEFQRAALPSRLPHVGFLRAAARYEPAARRAAVGGDWYDLVAVDDERALMVVGDVVGHGLSAAATMGRLRTAFNVIVSMHSDPAAVLERLDRQVDVIPEAFCTTVACALIDHRQRMLTWSRAGHLPPLVLSAGRATILDDPGMPPLGVVPDVPTSEHTRCLLPGDVVVLYTDGLVERRGESLDEGLRRLAIVAEELADLEPDEFPLALVEALVPEEHQHDDIAVLAVRYEADPGEG